MCEYCERSMSLGFAGGSVSVGTKQIIQGNGEDEPSVYVEDGELCLEYEGVIWSEPINCCPMCRRKLGGDAS